MILGSLYLDLNSYFASVEQQARPELRGRPVGVAPVMAETSCCIAASYEAKRHGVKTGTGIGEARELCPGIAIVQARPALYVEYHHRIVAAVESCAPIEGVWSIDEMSVELTGSQRRREVAERLARAMKQAIHVQVGEVLHCSVGIAPNRYLAKTASNMQKPDGLTVIEPGELPHVLHRLELGDLNGIGRHMLERLHTHGITTVEQLCAASKHKLRAVWGGVEGERMHARLRGEHVPLPPTRRSSVGHSHVLPPELRSEPAALAVLYRLLHKAAMRLRHENLLAGGLMVQMKYVNGMAWGEKTRFAPTDDTLGFIDRLAQLWALRPKMRTRPLWVGVTLVRLEEAHAQSLDLFAPEHARGALDTVVDRINLRFGPSTVYFGGAHLALASHAAPMRISFTHIPDLVVERDAEWL